MGGYTWENANLLPMPFNDCIAPWVLGPEPGVEKEVGILKNGSVSLNEGAGNLNVCAG